jgi:glycosyltransferase involved in cell wall biosynthesis
MGFEQACKQCPAPITQLRSLPEKIWKIRRDFYTSQKSLSFIAPSQWMANAARKSSLLEGKEIHQIYNPQKIKAPTDKKRLESIFNIAILGSNYHQSKGSSEAVNVVNRLLAEFKENLVVTVIGKLPLELVKHQRVFQLPDGSTQDAVLRALNGVDILIYCSRADTLPSLLIEAQSEGVAVVAMDFGGVGETFSHEKSGILVNRSLEEVFQASRSLILDRSRLNSYQDHAKEFARSRFGMDVITKKYQDIFYG